MMSGQQLPPPPEPRPAVRHSRPVETGPTVCVACKLPGGLKLRIYAENTYKDPQRDGSFKDVVEWRAIPGAEFDLKGPHVASAGNAYLRPNSAIAELLPGGYALNYGVPKDLWERWYSQHRKTHLVEKGIVFAAPSLAAATQEAKDARDVKSGLEPIDPDNIARRLPGGVDRRVRIGEFQAGEPGTSPR